MSVPRFITKGRRFRRISVLVIVAIASTASLCQRSTENGDLKSYAETFRFDKTRVHDQLRRFTATPHPFGSPEQKTIAAYIRKQAQPHAAQVYTQSFTAATPVPAVLNKTPSGPRALTRTLAGQNIYAVTKGAPQGDCAVLIGSHYDTKRIPGVSYVGANDSASTSVLLLNMLRYFSEHQLSRALKCQIVFVWFDGEESVLPGWYDGESRHPAKIQDNTYGSRHAVSNLKACQQHRCLTAPLPSLRVRALILLDMLGLPQLRFSRDSGAPPALMRLFEKSLTHFQASRSLTRFGRSIEDDHIPFRQAGIPAINLINFEDLSNWHKPGDTLDTLSLSSLEKAGRIALLLSLLTANTKSLK